MFLPYLLVFFGVLLEGEFCFGIGIYFCMKNSLSVTPLFLCAFLGAYLGDLSCFFWGRKRPKPLLQHWPKLSQMVSKVMAWFAKRPIVAVLLLRFQIGLRILGNHELGRSQIPTARYLLWTPLACWLWTLVIFFTWFIFLKLALQIFAANLL